MLASYTEWHGTNKMCYPSEPNTVLAVNMGVVMSTSAAVQWLAPAEPTAMPFQLRAAMRAVNNVFEGQLSMQFNVTAFRYADEGHPFNDPGCTVDIRTTLKLFKTWAAAQTEPVAVWYLIDGCFDTLCESDACTVGITSSFAVCPVAATAVVSINGANTWTTIAHELGHNLGAAHPFDGDEGAAGEFGGLMDYYEPTTGGAIQFNTIESKSTICNGVAHLLAQCPPTMYSRAPVQDPPMLDGPDHTPAPVRINGGTVGVGLLAIALLGLVWIQHIYTAAHAQEPLIEPRQSSYTLLM